MKESIGTPQSIYLFIARVYYAVHLTSYGRISYKSEQMLQTMQHSTLVTGLYSNETNAYRQKKSLDKILTSLKNLLQGLPQHARSTTAHHGYVRIPRRKSFCRCLHRPRNSVDDINRRLKYSCKTLHVKL